MPKLSSINDVRLAMFQLKYARTGRKAPLEKIQGINPSGMPPCHDVLHHKILRTNFVASMWKKAHLTKPCVFKAEEYGWVLTHDKFAINWFDCAQLPQSIVNILEESEPDNSDETESETLTPSYSSDEAEYDEFE